MFSNTVILAGTVVIEGLAFRWIVTDGWAQQVTVSNARLGTRSEQLNGSPDQQARAMSRALLDGKVSVPDVDPIEDCGAVP